MGRTAATCLQQSHLLTCSVGQTHVARRTHVALHGVCRKTQAVSCPCCALQHRLEQAERLNAQLEAKVAQLELQQKSLQAQNEILSKVGWAAASHMGGGQTFSCPDCRRSNQGLQPSLPFSLWAGIILLGRQRL